MGKRIHKRDAAVDPLSITAPADPQAQSSGGGSVAVTWPDYNTVGGAVVTGGRTPYTVTYLPTNGSLFAVGSTLVTASVIDADGRTDSDTFHVIVATPDPPPDPDPLVVTAPSNVTLLSYDGNPVVGVWDAAVLSGGSLPYTVSYKESGVTKTSGVSTFAVGAHTITIFASSADGQSDNTKTFTVTINAASAGDIAELRDTHPMTAGLTSQADVDALVAVLTNASYREKAYLQALINDIPNKVKSTALTVDTPYATLSGSADIRNATILYSALNCAYLAMVDPAALRTGGLTFSTGYPFTTAATPTYPSGLTIGTTCTSADWANLAFALLTEFNLTNKSATYQNRPYIGSAATPGALDGGRLVISQDNPHSYSTNNCQTTHCAFPFTYDWAYNDWTTAQREYIGAALNRAFLNDLRGGTDGETMNYPGSTGRPSDATANLTTGLFYSGPTNRFIGTNESWDLSIRVGMYLVALNDVEFGSSAQRAAVWAQVEPWINRITTEVAVHGGSGQGWFWKEAIQNYGTDSFTHVMTLALLRSCFLGSDPFETCESNLIGIPDTLGLMVFENERDGGQGWVHATGMNPPSSVQSGLLQLHRGAMLAWGETTAAQKSQWLLEQYGREPESGGVSYRYAQAVLRNGLLNPYGPILNPSDPASWTRVAGSLKMWGDPAAKGTPQVISHNPPFNYGGGHSDYHGPSWGAACGGQLFPLRAGEMKQGAGNLTGVPSDKEYITNTLVLLTSAGVPITHGASAANTVNAAPYTATIYNPDEYWEVDRTDYGFIQTDLSKSWQANLITNYGSNLTSARRFLVYVQPLRCVVVAYLIEGIPGTATAYNRVWVSGQPTWIDGTQSTISGHTTVNGFVYGRESTDATALSIENASAGAIAAVTNRVNALRQTHAKGYLTVLLPATRTIQARGGSDWTVPASPIFKEFQTPATTGANYSFEAASVAPLTEAQAQDNWRYHAWGQLRVIGSGASQYHLAVAQIGCSDVGDPNYVGSRIAAAAIDGGDVWVTHLPDASAPWAVAIPKLNASVQVDKTYAFVIAVPVATKILLTGLPISSAVGVSAASAGGNTYTVTVAASGAFTSTSKGALLVTIATNGAIT